jgi:hypothetical protein
MAFIHHDDAPCALASGPRILTSGAMPATQAYVQQLRTLGAVVTPYQMTALDKFWRGAGTEGLVRLFLPVWGIAAANAVDAVLPTRSGSFVGTVNYTGKAATGDGTTGYFDMVCDTTTTAMDDLSFWLAIHQLAGGVGMSRAELPIGGAGGGAQATVGIYANVHAVTTGSSTALTPPAVTTGGLNLGYRSAVDRGAVLYNGVITSTHGVPPAEVGYAGAIWGLAIPNGGVPVYHSDRPTALLAAGNATLTPAQSEALAIRLHTLVTQLRA